MRIWLAAGAAVAGFLACTPPVPVPVPVPVEDAMQAPDLGVGLDSSAGGVDGAAPADAAIPVPDAARTDGGRSDAGGPARCPADTVRVAVPGTPAAQVCIDQYEAATVQLLPDGSERAWSFDRPVDGLTVRAVVAKGQKPQAYISGAQAQAACQRAGKRLCTAAEWRAACQGPSGFTYPYGNTYTKGACNEGRATNPVNDCFGSGSGVFTYKNMNDPCCVNKPNTLAAGGAFPLCKSAYGVFDLHGNLHEWVDATTASGKGVFQGGFFVDAKINGAGCLYKTTAHEKTYHDYSTGFRCCVTPD